MRNQKREKILTIVLIKKRLIVLKIASCFLAMKLIVLILLLYITNEIYGTYHRDSHHVRHSGPRIIPSKSIHNVTFAIILWYILLAVQRMHQQERPMLYSFMHLNALIKKITKKMAKLRNRAKFVRLF